MKYELYEKKLYKHSVKKLLFPRNFFLYKSTEPDKFDAIGQPLFYGSESLNIHCMSSKTRWNQNPQFYTLINFFSSKLFLKKYSSLMIVHASNYPNIGSNPFLFIWSVKKIDLTEHLLQISFFVRIFSKQFLSLILDSAF